MRRRRFDLSGTELGLERVEIDRTTSADQLDGLPPRWSTPPVCLLRLFRWEILRASSRSVVRRRRTIRVPALLRIGLREPARIGTSPPA
jgi:hypothetical protein